MIKMLLGLKDTRFFRLYNHLLINNAKFLLAILVKF